MNRIKTYTQYETAAKRTEKRVTVSVLLNSVYYFLQHVFIIVSDYDYRLVVLHNDKVLTDQHYKTKKGAKIAFYRFYKNNIWRKGIKPDWSHCYHADSQWMNEMFEILNRGQKWLHQIN